MHLEFGWTLLRWLYI